MAKKKAAAIKETRKELSKAERFALDQLIERGLNVAEIIQELEIPEDIVRNYIDNKFENEKKEKVKGIPLPFAVKNYGNSSVVQMTQAASEISDGVVNRPSKKRRIEDSIYRPHQ